uniref:Uncharacterized protein n=1 Tax=Siphoviridae sp. ctTnV63 TaxID=2825523 RepID=A0A8S5NWK0_9CAUD|nr:MAG TPA: hypothetical protein [Siphoviridae sp. ctTnV63]
MEHFLYRLFLSGKSGTLLLHILTFLNKIHNKRYCLYNFEYNNRYNTKKN